MGRVVGLAGEEVAINGGSVYINGCLLKEDCITEACPVDMESITVGEGMFLLLPDARGSMQSTASEELIISAERIIGRVAVRVAPISRVAVFE